MGVSDTNKITPHSTFLFPQQVTSALRITLHTYLAIFIQLYTEDQKDITILLVCYDNLKRVRFRNDSYNPASSWNYNVPKGHDPSLEKRKVSGRLFCMLPCLLLCLSLLKAILVYTWLPSKFGSYIYHFAGNTHHRSKLCFIRLY